LDIRNKSYDLFGANRHLLPFENSFQKLKQYPYKVSVYLDSTLCKVSKDIKFAKFGPVDYFLLNLQDHDRIRDLNLKIKSGSGLTGG
jgi:hypothetical protein